MKRTYSQLELTQTAEQLATQLYDELVKKMEPILNQYHPDIQEEVSMHIFNKVTQQFNDMNQDNDVTLFEGDD